MSASIEADSIDIKFCFAEFPVKTVPVLPVNIFNSIVSCVMSAITGCEVCTQITGWIQSLPGVEKLLESRSSTPWFNLLKGSGITAKNIAYIINIFFRGVFCTSIHVMMMSASQARFEKNCSINLHVN